jgi:hypothetical protein
MVKLYQPFDSAIRPENGDGSDYVFRFFCSATPGCREGVSREYHLSKSNPTGVCACGAEMSVEFEEGEPELVFSGGNACHCACKKVN